MAPQQFVTELSDWTIRQVQWNAAALADNNIVSPCICNVVHQHYGCHAPLAETGSDQNMHYIKTTTVFAMHCLPLVQPHCYHK